METLPQKEPKGEPKRLLQAQISEDAYRRIKVAAAKRDVAPGQIISELAEQLPPVEDAE